MIIDALQLFTGGTTGVGNSDGATDSPTTGTQNSSNVIDYGIGATATTGIPNSVAGGGARDMGIGDDPALNLVVIVTTAFASGTSLQIGIAGAVDNAAGVPSTFNTWYLSPAIAEAALLAGARLMDIDFPRPPAGLAIPRFVRLSYVTVGTHTAGKLEAFISLDRDDHPYSSTGNQIMGGYPAGINIAN